MAKKYDRMWVHPDFNKMVKGYKQRLKDQWGISATDADITKFLVSENKQVVIVPRKIGRRKKKVNSMFEIFNF